MIISKNMRNIFSFTSFWRSCLIGVYEKVCAKFAPIFDEK